MTPFLYLLSLHAEWDEINQLDQGNSFTVFPLLIITLASLYQRQPSYQLAYGYLVFGYDLQMEKFTEAGGWQIMQVGNMINRNFVAAAAL